MVNMLFNKVLSKNENVSFNFRLNQRNFLGNPESDMTEVT